MRVAVFGDFCLDAYWWLDEDDAEKSIETGLVRRRVHRQQYSLGGAGNVVANLIDLGVIHVKAVGAIGIDLFGGEVLRLLEERRVDTTELVMQGEGWQTMVYAKPYRSDEEDNRLDFGSSNTVSAAVIESLVRALSRAAAESDVVVLNQQLQGGISTPELIARINEVISAYQDTRFIVDARHRASLYQGAIFKLNAIEAGHILGEFTETESVPFANAASYAQRLSLQTGQPVFLTRGEQGILVADGDEVHEVPGIQIIERTDSVGAGDTVVASLAAVLGAGYEALAAAKFANIAASITVRKLQTTGTATPDEIKAVGDHPDYVYSPELADDARQARLLEGTEIELVGALPERLQIKHAIFDHDGTISTLREGWEQIMEPMMVQAILGSQYSSVDTTLLQKVRNAVQHFIDKTTGVQTLVQMQGLVQMVRQFGFVPYEEVLDEHGYKRIYNETLL
ncbi:MAG TPA: PfkB family carbohydrate kinase, partial [Candidatus Dormibacteraeota bacterium]|nr:PfkB family carbohydrate kinase [Candidatus Dormibacteraeota bacterium]